MRRCTFLILTAALLAPYAGAQKHAGSPPTAPPRQAPAQPLVPVSSGLGPIQFVSVNYGVPAPQSLTRQLRVDDERTRAAALSAIGAPAQYLQRGHTGMPHSIALEFANLGSDDDLDALLTVELDQHIVTAILVPDGDNWRRIATVFVADSFDDPRITPDTFVRTARALLDHGRYRAIFHASTVDAQANYIEYEAHLRVINKRAFITISFVSASRDCPAATPTSKSSGCNVLRRWLQPDPNDPNKRVTLVSATGHLSPHDLTNPLNLAPTSEVSHLRNFDCQPFLYSDQQQHYEPTAPSTACPSK